ncbi:hypothetical protein [Thalassobium sp. R2A62]|jgi:hypothetical protein|uniref:hypothetical protein n=1 Tax=Thalassobium sp. R2A62 TaxID=633131 RepID=UPI0001B1CAF9|nr:hypothetical protein [Thalassobium sp. R2A62]EET48250.1 hypothetical protein TR2A62_0561 [Thalassobium sp. R2A62]MDG1339149.1 hypothetical protein [Paracoccaceae bacterium]MDG2451405.1 hypothetical protein [Paracoccaceae bacterium]
MIGRILIPAVLTGGFCSGFAVLIDAVLPPLMGGEVAIIAGLSGFLGSLFAYLLVGRK